MTAAGGTAPVGGRRGLAVGAGVAVVAVVILVVLAGRGGGGGADEPTSTAPTGAKGLALLIGQLGGTVDTSGRLPVPGAGVVLVLDDQLTGPARAGVQAWVRSGGTLVVADPSSDLAGVSPAEGDTPDSGVSADGGLPPDCEAPWVQGVDGIDVPDGNLLAPPSEAVQMCFGGDGAYFAIERSVGRGSVIALAGPDLWTNQELGRAANSVLAADLLLPPGGGRVAWLTGAVGGGQESLTDAIPDRVDELLVGGLVAVVVLVLARARRIGRPVDEEVPVVIPGSELVGAVGRLLDRNGQQARAAELLRGGLAQDLATELAVRVEADPDAAVRRVAEVTGRDPRQAADIMAGPVPTDDQELVALATEIDQLRQEVRRVHR